MFGSFHSKAEKEQKRQALLREVERDLENDRLKREAYADTDWITDINNNRINLSRAKNSTTIQTQAGDGRIDDSIHSASTQAGDGRVNTSIGTTPPRSVFSSEKVEATPQATTQATSSSPNVTRNLASEFNDAVDEDESIEQEQAHDKIKELYRENPELIDIEIAPIVLDKDGRETTYTDKDGETIQNEVRNEEVYIGKNGFLYDIDTKEESKVSPDTIDWVATLGWFVSRKIVKFVKDENNRLKLGLVGLFKEVAEASLSRRPEERAYEELMSMFINNPRKMAQLDRVIQPLTADEDTPSKLSDFTIRINFPENRLFVMKRESQRENPSKFEEVNWVNTLNYIKKRAEILNINLESPDRANTKRRSKSSPEITPSQRRSSKVTRGDDQDVSRAALPKSNDQKSVESIAKQAESLIEHSSNYVHPVMKDGGRAEKSVYIGTANDIDDSDEAIRGDLVFYKANTWEPISSKETQRILKNINWSLTRQNLINTLKEIREKSPNFSVINRINDIMIDNGLETRSQSKDFVKREQRGAPAQPRKSVGLGLSKIVGRGLRGAGRATNEHGLRGYSYTSKNLRTIQGSGTASDLKYKQLGSKFIRITDLRLTQPKLKLVYANRSQVGRIIDITPGLAKLLDNLVFTGDINQQQYNQLSINDKKIFQDILRLCHLETTFLNPPADPLQQLQAEWDKLRSQIMLGNDNPQNIKELKALSLDLYNNGLLNDEQIREIISL